jgi:thiamine-phosphate pyrophosphorylase
MREAETEMRKGECGVRNVRPGSPFRIPHSAFRNPREWGVYLVTDRTHTGGRDIVAVVSQAIRGGVRAVQLREKDLDAIEQYRLAERLAAACRESGTALLVNDRVDLALAVGADGVHLTRKSLPPAEARKLLGADRLLGISCHSLADVEEAVAGGVDFIVLGPVFETPSKMRYGPPITPAILGAARAVTSLPILAIGGIRASRVPEAIAAGADGVAVISAVLAAPDPAVAAAELLQAVETARRKGG